MTSIISHASSDYTLVDSLHFVLSHDNPLNTVIRGSGGRRLYRVSSDNLVDPEWTMISREGGGEPVATIYWSKIGLHKVSTAGGRPRKISKFLSLGRMFSE
ncbi:hypothetical protein FRC20_002486 [Serendipita sp. 405]|nr:hypothetical protein FRC20_002486 [Serendipita sp. 405]